MPLQPTSGAGASLILEMLVPLAAERQDVRPASPPSSGTTHASKIQSVD
jgi:hypothetical protein